MRRTLAIILIGFGAGLAGAYTYDHIRTESMEPQSLTVSQGEMLDNEQGFSPVQLSRSLPDGPLEDFVEASANATESVVYIRNISSRSYGNSWFDLFFDGQGRSIETVSSGSGVILMSNGYIVTNNHVIKGAERIEVVHNKGTYDAALIGTDPSSDLAVIKIEASNLPAISTSSSSEVMVGEWVLAIGNPFNLTSTVTAGIVSAKGRELNILKDKFPIESFIQTDAAINPGNSGGALVNKKGQLIGINTAIVSGTGYYAGYGFAVPSDIVLKVVGDIIAYGEVQKAFVGAGVIDLTSEVAGNLDLKLQGNDYSGVVVNYIQEEGAADRAGLKEGDIVMKIDGVSINSQSDFDEVLSYHSPGDRINVEYERAGKVGNAIVTLTNREGTTTVLKREVFTSEYLGGELEKVSKVERDLLDIENGVKIVKVYDRGLIKSLGLNDGFIVTAVNYTEIVTPEQLDKLLSDYRGRIRIEGVDARGRKGYYTFYLR